MKVPFTQNQPSLNSSSKQVNCNNTHTHTHTRNTTFQGYEPKSVLELRRSPSPVTTAEKPASNSDISTIWDDSASLQLEDHVLNHFDDWDSLMRELGSHEDSNSTPTSRPTLSIPQLDHSDTHTHTQFQNLPEFPSAHSFDTTQCLPSDFTLSDNISTTFPSFNNNTTTTFDLSHDLHHIHHNNNININWSIGFDYVDELIRLAECFETNSLHLTQVILGRLNQRLRAPTGKPLQRAAFYFKEALQTLLTGSTRLTRPSTSSEVIQSIKAHKAFSNISPIPMFSSFMANQAVLEAVDGSILIHVIDFDIGLGGHWASFLKELADKAESQKTAPPVLRITAVVAEEYAMESTLIRENLTQFARELNIGFNIDFVLLRTFEFLSFKAIKFVEDEKIAILLSPAIFRHVGTGFLNDIRRVSPHVVVHLDCEGLIGLGAMSFRQTVIDGLEFYSTLLESFEAANGGGGGGDDWMKKIESSVIYPKILDAVGVAGRRGTPWREAFGAAGLRPVALSQFADFQAECLIRRIQVRGFHVARRQAEMLLCWHERALVATSAWRY